jgi:hypothetical protein
VHSQPWNTVEVSALRQGTMLNLPGTRAEQINAMRVKGIAIEDRMNA